MMGICRTPIEKAAHYNLIFNASAQWAHMSTQWMLVKCFPYQVAKTMSVQRSKYRCLAKGVATVHVMPALLAMIQPLL
jgi:hypothetical protein